MCAVDLTCIIIFTFYEFFLQRWRDYKLAWDPLEYGNITEIRLPQKVVWKPDILMYNRYDMIVSQVTISGELVYMHIDVQHYLLLYFKGTNLSRYSYSHEHVFLAVVMPSMPCLIHMNDT